MRQLVTVSVRDRGPIPPPTVRDLTQSALWRGTCGRMGGYAQMDSRMIEEWVAC